MKHFLLCNHERCSGKSEKWWISLAKKRKIVNFIPDHDLIDDELDDECDDFDTKIKLQNFELIHYTHFLPLLEIQDNNQKDSRAYDKTYFQFEKANVINPKTNMIEKCLLLSDTGCGKTVGNGIEHLDHFPQETKTNIILSSLNGTDTSTKRICRIHLVGKDNQVLPMDVIVPRDNIPRPPVQSMRQFIKHEPKKNSAKSSIKWIDDVTQEDIDTLPIILVGLNNIKYHPEMVPLDVFTATFKKNHSTMIFYKSHFLSLIHI